MSYLSFAQSHKKRSIAIIVGVALLTLTIMFLNSHKIAPVGWGFWEDINTTAGVAIGGYDPVAYHVEGISKKGDALRTFRWHDVDWHFVSDVNKSLFMANPEQYAPQYGGYCAYAVSKGVTSDVDPESWIIQDGKLYLMASDEVTTSWLEEGKEGIQLKADEHWLKR